MSLTEADKAIRATGIGASEAWKIVLGHGAHDVFLRLVHPELLVPGDDDAGLPARKGNALEPVVAELFAERYGLRPEQLEACGTLRHPEHPFVLATPDRLVLTEDLKGIDELLEIKCPTINTRDEWGPDLDTAPDAFPLKYRIQATIQMVVTKVRKASLAALIEGEGAIRVYPVPWDEELAGLIVEQLVRFWRDHVLTKEPPSPDSSEAAASFLRKKYPKNVGTYRAPTGDAIHLVETGEVLDGDAALARELARVNAQMRELKQRKALLTHVAMGRTGEADGVEGLWNWKLPKTGKGRVAWKSAALEGRVPAEIIAKHTAPAQRKFRLLNDEDDDNEET